MAHRISKVRAGAARFQQGERYKPAGDERNMSFEAGAPGSEQPTDAELRTAIGRRFEELPGSGNVIEVVVQGGNVTLSGIVVDRYVKYLAEEILLTTRGVRDVRNKLDVMDPDGDRFGSPDEEHEKVRAMRQRMRGQHARGS